VANRAPLLVSLKDGYENTLPVTLEEMIHHTKAAKRGNSRALLVADMPFLTYEYSPEGGAFYLADLQFCLKAIYLAPEGISAHLNVHEVQRLRPTVRKPVSNNNHAGAGTPDGHPSVDPANDGIRQLIQAHELGDGGTLSTRYDKA